MKYPLLFSALLLGSALFTSCDKLLDPQQELDITEKELYNDWYEYRSAEMGLYGLQQGLVEQLLILGELRADLMTVTPNAEADMVEICNFNASKKNKYARPTQFFKLISACNNFIRILEKKHPEVLDPDSPVTNYDRLYGEGLCMRAWAYFNAVRIYGEVPFISESLTSIDEIEDFVNSSGTYIDSVYIEYAVNGYDTLEYSTDTTMVLEKQYYNTDLVIDHFTEELEHKVKAVGVDHAYENNDASWEVTIWNNYAMQALLGQMYLTQGNLIKARFYFEKIINDPSGRYQLKDDFAYNAWANILMSIDNSEHIFSVWFGKTNFQQNPFQDWFEPTGVYHKYMLKPTRIATDMWETIWRNQVINEDPAHPWETEMTYVGQPGDFFRGYGVSYVYWNGSQVFTDIGNMLYFKSRGDYRTVNAYMVGMDTVISKYSVGKNTYDEDANYMIYRAAGIHLYLAEVYTWLVFEKPNGLVGTQTASAVRLVNDGSYYTTDPGRDQMGVRGRVGFGNTRDGINIANIHYFHDPYTNKITGYENLENNLYAKQLILEDEILDERARELAYEGERFYDLMRVAKRRDDPDYLASRVAAKFTGAKKIQVYNYLLDPANWYIHYFDE